MLLITKNCVNLVTFIYLELKHCTVHYSYTIHLFLKFNNDHFFLQRKKDFVIMTKTFGFYYLEVRFTETFVFNSSSLIRKDERWKDYQLIQMALLHITKHFCFFRVYKDTRRLILSSHTSASFQRDLL